MYSQDIIFKFRTQHTEDNDKNVEKLKAQPMYDRNVVIG